MPTYGRAGPGPVWLGSKFHTLVMQPTTLCNLDCAYCYLPLRMTQNLMPVEVAARCAAGIEEQASLYPVDVVWHGGEPTTTPIGHLRSLLAPFEHLRRDGLVRHGVQTNATRVDRRWCDLFTEYGFQVGVSVDGPAWANRERVDLAGRLTHERTKRGVAALRDAGIQFDVIAVVTPATIERPDELMEYFHSLGCRSVGFNIEEDEGSGRPGLDPTDAYAFWRRLIELRERGNTMPVRDIDRLTSYVALARHGCRDERPLDPIPTVTHDGDVVLLSPELAGIASDTYANFVAGNVARTPLPLIVASATQHRYVEEFGEALMLCQASCEFFDFCRGAQAGNRFFEHGRLDVTETAYCRNTRQALVRAAADHVMKEAQPA